MRREADPSLITYLPGGFLAMVREGLGVGIIPALSLGAGRDGITALPLRPRAPGNAGK
jgi:hypothetical protein